MKMSDSTSGVLKPLIWLLLLALIGVIALYNWYTTSLKQQLTGQGEAMEQTELQLLEAGNKVKSAAAQETRLKDEIGALTDRYQAEAKTLMGKLDDANQANAALQSDLEQLKQSSADAYAALQAEKQAGDQQIVALKGDIEQLNQTLADNAQQVEADMAAAKSAFAASEAQLREELAERADTFRSILEGSQPELAAQLSALDQQLESGKQALGVAEETIAALEADQADLNEQLAAVTQDRDSKAEALAQSVRDLEMRQAELSERQNTLMALQADLDAVKAQSAADIAALETKLQDTEAEYAQAQADAAAALRQSNADAEAALAQAQEQHAAQIAEAEGRIAQLSQELESQRSALATLQQQFETETAKLGEVEQLLAGVEAKLSMTEEQALQTKVTLEGQLAEAQARVVEAENTLASERELAAKEMATLQQDKRESLAYVRGLLSDMSALGGRKTDDGMLFNLGDEQLRFRISSAKLPNREFPILDQLAGLLTKYPSLTARIEGHTDNTGREETNLKLSQQRAETVMQELASRGVAVDRLEAVGVGPIRPVADNDTPYGRALNRRVEVYVNES
jgi:outer membrane protein OmpA-like peptidoglycan-associated protein